MSEPTFRRATRADLAAIVELLADDDVNGWREKPGEPLDPGYVAAFEAIDPDPNNVLVVGELDGAIVATAQLTFAPGLIQRGATRAIIEGVRVSSRLRSKRVGQKLIAHLERLAHDNGCIATQLTTSKPRVHAQRFYERIGYTHSHFGFKRDLS